MLVVTMLAHAFITFSASPHCHWTAVLIEPCTTIVMDRSPGVAASASRRATSSFSVPGSAWSTTWYFFDNSSLSVLAKASVSICWFFRRHLLLVGAVEADHLDQHFVVLGQAGLGIDPAQPRFTLLAGSELMANFAEESAHGGLILHRTCSVVEQPAASSTTAAAMPKTVFMASLL